VDDLGQRAIAVLTLLAERPDYSTPGALAGVRQLDLSTGQVRRILGDLQERELVFQRLDETWRVRRRARELLAGTAPREREEVWPLLDDRYVRRAIGSVQRRSERQQDVDRLALTFVDPGFSDRLENDNNQVIYGRRGTGKTHVLRILDRSVRERNGALSLYLDLRLLGSSSIYEDSGRPIGVRVASLLKDLLKAVGDSLEEAATDPNARDVRGSAEETIEAFREASSRSTLAGEHRGHDQDVRQSASREGNPLDHVVFAEVNGALDAALDALGAERFLLLLDEWNAIPLELQPLLAEFLKRSLFTLPRATVKLATLEHRSRFAEPTGLNNVVGFEVGADISTALELDEYFVYDRNPLQTERTYAELLYRHVGLEAELAVTTRRFVGPDWRGSLRTLTDNLRLALPEDALEFEYLAEKHGVDGGDAFVDALFDDRTAFRELVRAGEGVTRDFINIFAGAHDEARRRGERAITVDAVRAAASQWFETDKAPNMAGPQAAALEYISREVLAKHAERIFFLSKRYERHEAVRSLFDFRLLHLLHRGYVDPESPLERFNAYALDYGLYVQLLGTSHAPPVAASVPIAERRLAKSVLVSGEQLAQVWNDASET
jgi:hypothetical protein